MTNCLSTAWISSRVGQMSLRKTSFPSLFRASPWNQRRRERNNRNQYQHRTAQSHWTSWVFQNSMCEPEEAGVSLKSEKGLIVMREWIELNGTIWLISLQTLQLPLVWMLYSKTIQLLQREHSVCLKILTNGLCVKVNPHSSGDGIGDDQGGRGQIIGLCVGVDTPCKVPVTW